MPHLISFTRGTSLVLSFPHYLAEHAHFSSLKQLYGLHLCLYIYWHSTVVVPFQVMLYSSLLIHCLIAIHRFVIMSFIVSLFIRKCTSLH